MTNTEPLNYVEAGQGRPVVLLHGYPLSSAIWHHQQKNLSDSFRVIAPDLRGHGRSPAPLGVYQMDLLAGDVLRGLDAMHIQKAVVIGHSMGGYVALAAWKLAPERFLALGLIASQAGADTEDGQQGRHKMAEKVADSGAKVVAEAMLPKLFAPGFPAESPIVESVHQLILSTNPQGIIGSLQGMAIRPDSGTILPKISIPVLILTGDQDQIIPPAIARAMAVALKSATLRIIANAGHMPMLEQPEATTSAIRDFLTSLPREQTSAT